MRVAIIGSYPLDAAQIWGGEQAAFTYLVKELCQIDNLQVHILALNGATAGQVLVDSNGATVHILPPLPRFELFRRYAAYQAYIKEKLIQIQPDVVHTQGAVHHAYVALKSGYPTVVTVHGVQREDSRYQRSFYLRLRQRLASLMLERYTMRHTRHLIAIGRYVTTYFSDLLRPDVEVYYIPNAIDGAFFNLTDTSPGHIILFAGRVIRRKRVLELTQAFVGLVQQVPAAQLRIAGEYTSEKDYADSIREFIQSANLSDKVHLLGPLSEDEILREFAGCNLLALPSVQETTPMVIAQAMAAAKPVVATPVGGVAEMLTDDKTGILVEGGNINALKDGLLRLLSDPTLQANMGQAGRRFAIENYKADSVARRTYNVYQKIVSAKT